MDHHELRHSLAGVIAFPITPFERTEGLEVDEEAFCRHIDFIAGSGVSALVVAGGTGEFFSLTSAEIIGLAGLAVDVARKRLPVIVAVGHNVAVATDVVSALDGVGLDGLLLMPPYYATPDAESLVDYYRRIAASAREIGCVVYMRDHVRLEVATVTALADVPNIVAIKDGQGIVRDFIHARAALGDRFKWLGGAGDDLVAAYAGAHADGYTSSLACFDPRLSLTLWELAIGQRRQELEVLLSTRVLPWYELRRLRRGYEVSVVKAAVEAFGGIAGLVRPPLANLSDDHLRAVQLLAMRIGRLGESTPGGQAVDAGRVATMHIGQHRA